MLNSTKTWQEEKIKHTAEHIGIISEGALKTLVREVIAQTREETIRKVDKLINNEYIIKDIYKNSDDLLNDIKKELNKLKK